jgi:hypothetical protein
MKHKNEKVLPEDDAPANRTGEKVSVDQPIVRKRRRRASLTEVCIGILWDRTPSDR